MDARSLRRHVRQLCTRHRITIRPARSGFESAEYDARRISVSVDGPATYLTALHEIAHIVHKPAAYPWIPSRGESRRRYREAVLKAEVAAWTWAIKRSIIPVPDWMFQRIASCLQQYKGRTGPDL